MSKEKNTNATPYPKAFEKFNDEMHKLMEQHAKSIDTLQPPEASFSNFIDERGVDIDGALNKIYVKYYDPTI